jgi:hypothetical protein
MSHVRLLLTTCLLTLGAVVRFKLQQNRPQRVDGRPWVGGTRTVPCPEA